MTRLKFEKRMTARISEAASETYYIITVNGHFIADLSHCTRKVESHNESNVKLGARSGGHLTSSLCHRGLTSRVDV